MILPTDEYKLEFGEIAIMFIQLLFKRINIITAILSTILFLLLMVKFVTKRTKESNRTIQKVDRVLMKFHQRYAYWMLWLAIIHGIFSLTEYVSLGWVPYVLGNICLLSCMLSITFFNIRKKFPQSRWIAYHGICAFIAFVILIVHIIAQTRHL